MGALIADFECAFLQHGDLAETLQAMYLARADLNSNDRDMFVEHLKMIGIPEEEYNNWST